MCLSAHYRSELEFSGENLMAALVRLRRLVLAQFDEVLGLDLLHLSRADLRVRPADALVTEAEIEARLTQRKEARAAKDFARSDALRDELIGAGVEVMDGDPIGWDWRVEV